MEDIQDGDGKSKTCANSANDGYLVPKLCPLSESMNSTPLPRLGERVLSAARHQAPATGYWGPHDDGGGGEGRVGEWCKEGGELHSVFSPGMKSYLPVLPRAQACGSHLPADLLVFGLSHKNESSEKGTGR